MNMARELQNDQTIKNRLYDGGLRDQSPLLALWSPIGIAIEYQNCQVSHCHHVLFTDGQQVHPEYM